MYIPVLYPKKTNEHEGLVEVTFSFQCWFPLRAAGEALGFLGSCDTPLPKPPGKMRQVTFWLWVHQSLTLSGPNWAKNVKKNWNAFCHFSCCSCCCCCCCCANILHGSEAYHHVMPTGNSWFHGTLAESRKHIPLLHRVFLGLTLQTCSNQHLICIHSHLQKIWT